MSEIHYLIRFKTNMHGDVQPQNYDYCPKYQNRKEMTVCMGNDFSCEGLRDGNVFRENKDMTGMLQCTYLVGAKQ